MEIIWGRFVEKTGGQKSRATVPLKSISIGPNHEKKSRGLKIYYPFNSIVTLHLFPALSPLHDPSSGLYRLMQFFLCLLQNIPTRHATNKGKT
jgi:hypothetical protein